MSGRKTERYTLEALKELRVKDLRVLAKEQKLIGYSQLRKADLVERLHRHLAAIAKGKAGAGRRSRLPALEAALHHPADGAGSAPTEESPAPPPAPSEPGDMRDASWYAPDLPQGYGHNRLTLMVRDPNWLYCYWELRPELLDETRTEFTNEAWPVLRVHLLGEDGGVLDAWEYGVGPDALNWYVNTARPGSRFRAELGLRDAGGQFRLLVASNAVTAPQDAPSERWDEEWVGLSRETWERLERRERPFPGSMGGWDHSRVEISQVAVERLGGSEGLSAFAPGSADKQVKV
jgi:hypothetical protein